MDHPQLEAMTEDQILDFADACAETARRAEVDLLRAAYQWAIVHSPDRLDPATAALPGREQARRYGGAGTPEVTEFAAAAFGARVGRSTYAARQLIADALDLQHRHRQLWARVRAGEVRASYARHVTKATRDLTPEQAAYVDAAVVESADGRITWSRFEALVEAKVAQAAPEVAREREERAARATFAKKLRGDAHGMGSFLIRGDLATIDRIDAAVTAEAEQRAAAFPDATDDENRVQAVLELLCGPDSGVEVVLHVHTFAGPDREPIARVEGHGPVTEDWVRTVLGPRARFTILPVFDIAGQAPVDAYEIPDRHRQAVRLMTPADIFPFASCLSRDQQVDHTVAHADGGVTGVGNYGPMTITHHRIKTHGGWECRQPFPGIYLWRDPHGTFYLVDHTGTRRLPSTPTAPEPRVIELYRTPFRIELDLAA